MVAVAVGVVCSSQALPALAAGTPTDLGGVLIDAPTADWVPIPDGVQGPLTYGPLDAKALAAESGNATAVANELSREQFTRSYRKGWGLRGTDTVLLEKVEEFAHQSGAADHLIRAKYADQTDANFKGLFGTPGLDPAYGASFVQKDGWRSAGIVFTKGNLLFSVIGGSSKPVNTDLLLRQARQQDVAAPDQTVVPESAARGSGGGSGAVKLAPGISIPRSDLVALIAGGCAVLVLVLAVVVGLAIWLPHRRGKRERARALTSRLPPFSADRRWWWDGARWQDGTMVAPPAAPRSPDGAHWFDGVGWRPVPPAQAPEVGAPR